MSNDVHSLPQSADFSLRWRVESEDATRALGAGAADLLEGGEIILLNGDLGMGKTCFVQGLCARLQVQEEVVSPTFTLVNTYSGRLTVHHLDFYRVAADHDLLDIGVPDILDAAWDKEAVVLVEWPGPLRPELGGSDHLELLVAPSRTTSGRIWYLRGVPAVPTAWQDLFERGGPVAC